MAENSGIEWTHHTFNPWIGCTKISAACDNCYAEEWNKRFDGGSNWGPHADRRRTKNWAAPVKWNKEAAALGIRYRVFCASLADVFDNHKSIAPEWRGDLWRLIRDTPHLDWLLLTKRPMNIAKMLPPDWGDGYANVWLGATVENKEATSRIWHLVKVPAVVHFLSCEPLLEGIDLTWCGLPVNQSGVLDCLRGFSWIEQWHDGEGKEREKQKVKDWPYKIDWVIAGGESGSQSRSADPDWFRTLRDQCSAAGVAFLFKQWSGGNQREIKGQGRALDGVVWDGYPTAATVGKVIQNEAGRA